MAHTKQALKRARQNERLRIKNKAMRSEIKTQVKAVRAAIASKDEAALAAAVQVTQSKLDKAAKRRVLHPNAAARLKSRFRRERRRAGRRRAVHHPARSALGPLGQPPRLQPWGGERPAQAAIKLGVPKGSECGEGHRCESKHA